MGSLIIPIKRRDAQSTLNLIFGQLVGTCFYFPLKISFYSSVLGFVNNGQTKEKLLRKNDTSLHCTKPGMCLAFFAEHKYLSTVKLCTA